MWIQINKSVDRLIPVDTIGEVASQTATHYKVKHWHYPTRYYYVLKKYADSFSPITGGVTYKNKAYRFVKYLEDCLESPNHYCPFTGKRCRIEDVSEGTTKDVYVSDLE